MLFEEFFYFLFVDFLNFVAHKFLFHVYFFSNLKTLLQKFEFENSFASSETCFCINKGIYFCSEKILNFVCFKKVFVIVVNNGVFFCKGSNIYFVWNNKRRNIFLILPYYNGSFYKWTGIYCFFNNLRLDIFTA